MTDVARLGALLLTGLFLLLRTEETFGFPIRGKAGTMENTKAVSFVDSESTGRQTSFAGSGRAPHPALIVPANGLLTCSALEFDVAVRPLV
jgi:hypothetical protein